MYISKSQLKIAENFIFFHRKAGYGKKGVERDGERKYQGGGGEETEREREREDGS
jgi:hypothetical protein